MDQLTIYARISVWLCCRDISRCVFGVLRKRACAIRGGRWINLADVLERLTTIFRTPDHNSPSYAWTKRSLERDVKPAGFRIQRSGEMNSPNKNYIPIRHGNDVVVIGFKRVHAAR